MAAWKFHAVIGGRGIAPADFLMVGSADQYGGPATGAGIAMASAIGMDNDFLHSVMVFQASSGL